MSEAWQTPHGARPNREGVEDGASRFPCVPARRAKLPGRSLEPFSNDRPRGMTVTAAMPYRIRLIGPTSLVAPTIGNDCGGFQICCESSFALLPSGFRLQTRALLTNERVIYCSQVRSVDRDLTRAQWVVLASNRRPDPGGPSAFYRGPNLELSTSLSLPHIFSCVFYIR
jgi:hypothetical protein